MAEGNAGYQQVRPANRLQPLYSLESVELNCARFIKRNDHHLGQELFSAREILLCSEKFRARGGFEHKIKTSAQQFDLGDDSRAHLRVGDLVELLDYARVAGMQVSDRVRIEQMH